MRRESPGVDASDASAPSLWELARVYLGISLLGFGGPNAHLALMLDEVVERRQWLTKERFVELMAVTNLLPGPNSSEVAIHVGYTQRGWAGALTTGLAFLLPTFSMVTGLSALYFRFGTLPEVESVFWGLQPVIVAIVVSAGIKIGRAAIDTRGQLVLAAVGAAVSLVSGPAIIVAMVVAGAVFALVERSHGGGGPGSGGPGDDGAGASGAFFGIALQAAGAGSAAGATAAASLPAVIVTVFLTHLWIGAVLFGGGYVLVALLEPYAVDQYGWLTSAQFLDGVALTQAVPGPISTLSAFVGYAAAGVPGAILGTVGIYLPAFAAVLLTAPRLERLRDVPVVKASLRGVVPVAAGAVLGVGASLGAAGVRDPVAALLAVVALVAAVWKKVPSLWLMAVGLAFGVGRALLLGPARRLWEPACPARGSALDVSVDSQAFPPTPVGDAEEGGDGQHRRRTGTAWHPRTGCVDSLESLDPSKHPVSRRDPEGTDEGLVEIFGRGPEGPERVRAELGLQIRQEVPLTLHPGTPAKGRPDSGGRGLTYDLHLEGRDE